MTEDLSAWPITHRMEWDGPEDVEIEKRDLRVDTYKSHGPGGQCVNTTDSAVRISHIPSGFSAISQESRSQIKNRDKALQQLKEKIFAAEMERREKEEHEAWKDSLETRKKPSGKRMGISKDENERNIVMSEIEEAMDMINNGRIDSDDLLGMYGY